MDTTTLIGKFLKGSLKNGGKFFGKCLSADDMFLVLSGDPGHDDARKVVTISEITEFYVETYLPEGKHND